MRSVQSSTSTPCICVEDSNIYCVIFYFRYSCGCSLKSTRCAILARMLTCFFCHSAPGNLSQAQDRYRRRHQHQHGT